MQIKIYITDDDPRIRSILGQTLERAGHQFCLCETSDELIDALGMSSDAAIVFLDIYMNGEDGISTIKRLQTVSRRFRLHFLTGGEVSTAIAASLIAKANNIDVSKTLYKPFPMEQFIGAVTDDISALTE